MKSTGQVVRVGDITSSRRAEMFALMVSYYEGIDRATFDADLDEKDWVIQILDEETQGLLGFSTQMLLQVRVAGRSIRALFSGDTIVDRDARGEWNLFQVSGWFLRSLLTICANTELYWFLISKGYKTYRILPLFFHEFYPRYDLATPPCFAAVIDALAAHKFADGYDRAAGIMRGGPGSCRLRPGVADVTTDRLGDPHVRFFSQRNPRHMFGDELCCVAPITLANFTPAAHRAMGPEPKVQWLCDVANVQVS